MRTLIGIADNAAKLGVSDMNWIGKIRPQVFMAIIMIGVGMIYAIRSEAYELASAFGGFVAMLAKEVIASDD